VRSFSIEQSKHPKWYFISVAYLDIVGNDINYFFIKKENWAKNFLRRKEMPRFLYFEPQISSLWSDEKNVSKHPNLRIKNVCKH